MSTTPVAEIDSWSDTPIRGYAGQAGINRGDAIALHIGTSRPTYTLEVYRMGWYGGTGGRLLQTVGPLPGQNPPVPRPEAGTGLIACDWPISFRLQTGADWVTGCYLVKLISSAGEVAYLPFVLRDDNLTADILYQVPVTTYQAYNNWGGKSLYDAGSNGGRAYKVSFDRPYTKWGGAGDFFEGDYNMIRWLESQGYSLAYATSIETQANQDFMKAKKVFLSNWHDEYWSKPMRDNLTASRDQGKHLAFFSANNIYWQIRFEKSGSDIPHRVIVCYKSTDPPKPSDPMTEIDPTLTTTKWRNPPVNQPENALLGIMFEDAFPYGVSLPWTVKNADHWIYRETGLRDGQTIDGLVGYEYDKAWDNGLTPDGLIQLAASPVMRSDGRDSTHNSSIYTAPSGALVFTAGTIYWAWKLDDNDFRSLGADKRVQQMTANLLNKMTGHPPMNPRKTSAEAPPTSYRDSVLADNPIAYWRLGETDGTIAWDEKLAYSGSYRNGPVLGQAGALVNDPNHAVAFTGINDYVDIPYQSSLNRPIRSIEVWAFPTGGSGTYRSIIASRDFPRGWIMYASDSNVWSFWLNNSAKMIALHGPTISMNTWTYLVATFDGSTARLYVNGSQAASGTASGYQPNVSRPLTIARGEAGTDVGFTGRIDEAAVYDKALGPAQILAHYTAGVGTIPQPVSGTRTP